MNDPLHSYPRAMIWPIEVYPGLRWIPVCRELPWPDSLAHDARPEALAQYAASLLEGSEALFLAAHHGRNAHGQTVLLVTYALMRHEA